MNTVELSRLVSKICGPFLVVMSPIFLVLLGLDPLGKESQSATLKEWIFILTVGLGGLILGIYMCRKEYGWFGGKKP